MKRIIFALAVTSICVSQTFGAMLSEGTRQLDVSGRIDETEEFNFNLGVGAGYFIMDNVEIGSALIFDSMHGGDILDINLSIFGEYNFPIVDLPNIVPYVGALAGLQYSSKDYGDIDTDDTSLVVAGYGGIKYFVVENLSIGTEVRILAATDDIYVNDAPGTFDNTDWDILVRTSFYF
jgi:hypothetical protein